MHGVEVRLLGPVEVLAGGWGWWSRGPFSSGPCWPRWPWTRAGWCRSRC